MPVDDYCIEGRAATYFKKHKISKGETVAKSLKERFDYGQNPDKTQGDELISSYECDYMTADAEFLLPNKRFCGSFGLENSKCGHTCPACH